MKKAYTIYILSILLLTMFILGCAKQPLSTTNTGQNNNGNQVQEPQGKMTLSTIYKFNALKTFTYRESTDIGGQRSSNDIVYTIRTDTLNGEETYVLTSNSTVESNILLTDMWINKKTNKCLQIVSNLISNGQLTPQPYICPLQGPYSIIAEMELTSSGTEEVDSPMGKLNAETYVLAGVTYYVAKNIPVPIKVVYADGSLKAVLTSYT